MQLLRRILCLFGRHDPMEIGKGRACALYGFSREFRRGFLVSIGCRRCEKEWSEFRPELPRRAT